MPCRLAPVTNRDYTARMAPYLISLAIITGAYIVMAAIDRLTSEVAELRTVADSAVLLIASLANDIRENIGNEDALNALADEIDASTNSLAAAVAENTPEAPAEPE